MLRTNCSFNGTYIFISAAVRIFAPVYGLVADRFGPITIFRGTFVARCVLVAPLVVIAMSTNSLTLIGAAAGMNALCGSLHVNTSNTMPALVSPSPEALNSSLSVVGALNTVSPLLGYLLGASLVSLATPVFVGATVAVIALAGGVLSSLIPARGTPAAGPTESAKEVSGFIWSVLGMFGLGIVAGASLGIVNTRAPLALAAVPGFGYFGYPLFEIVCAVFGIFAILGRRWLKPGWSARRMLRIAFGLLIIGVGVIPLHRYVGWYVGGAILGAGLLLLQVAALQVASEQVPRGRLGFVIGWFIVSINVGMTGGAMLAGSALSLFLVVIVVVVAGIVAFGIDGMAARIGTKRKRMRI